MMNVYRLRPSRIFLALLLAAYALAILTVFLLPAEIWARLAFACALLLLLLYLLWRDALLLAPASYVALRLQGRQATLFRRDGGEVTGPILSDSVVTPVLGVLNVLPQGKRRVCSLLIFFDSLEQERFREMRVRLKWGD